MASTAASSLRAPKENARRKKGFQFCFLAVTALCGFQVQFQALPQITIFSGNRRRLRTSFRKVPIKRNSHQSYFHNSNYNTSKYQNRYRKVDETTDPNELSLQELDTLFHKRRRNELNRVLSLSNMMVWEVMDDSWEGYLSNFPVYRVPAVSNSRKSEEFHLDLERLAVDGSENDDKNKIHYFYFPHQDDLCRAAKIFVEYNRRQVNATTTELLPPVKHILFVGFSRDFGAFSVPAKGAYWNEDFDNTTRYWEHCHGDSGEDLIQEYLDHRDTLAVITTQSHELETQKGHSIPLGLQHPDHARAILTHLQREFREQQRDLHTAVAPDEDIDVPSSGSRSKRLMVNSKPWPWRQSTLKSIEHTFQVRNTYDPGSGYQKYLEEMADSQFVLSPIGWGIDCYRNYEALYLGSIPIMETNSRTNNLFDIYQDLPVAWIDDLNHVTPEWLNDEYARILRNYKSYNWGKLTKHYWVEYAKAFGSTTANIAESEAAIL